MRNGSPGNPRGKPTTRAARRRTTKRKAKRKTAKRKTAKRKTAKRKATKRKTAKRIENDSDPEPDDDGFRSVLARRFLQ